MDKTLKILAFVMALGMSQVSLAQQPGANLKVHLDSKTISVQAQAEELFERENYRRAFVIYLNDLAPIGDKYAHYMLGFMILSGLGTEQDHVLASAWYRVAAERGEPAEFVEIRNELMEQLDEVDKSRSDELYIRLRREYSDIAISMREAHEAFREVSQVTTGSRLGSPPAAVTIVEPRGGNSQSGDALIHRTQRRMQDYLDYITGTLGVDRVDAETVTAGQLGDLDEQVQAYIRDLEDR